MCKGSVGYKLETPPNRLTISNNSLCSKEDANERGTMSTDDLDIVQAMCQILLYVVTYDITTVVGVFSQLTL